MTLQEILADDGPMRVFMERNPDFPKKSDDSLRLVIWNPRMNKEFCITLPSTPERGTIGEKMLKKARRK